jgi:hypothetical protein
VRLNGDKILVHSLNHRKDLIHHYFVIATDACHQLDELNAVKSTIWVIGDGDKSAFGQVVEAIHIPYAVVSRQIFQMTLGTCGARFIARPSVNPVHPVDGQQSHNQPGQPVSHTPSEKRRFFFQICYVNNGSFHK